MLKINGTNAPSPSALSVAIEDVSSPVERSASGDAVRDYTGTRRRLKLRWAHLTGAQLAALLAAVDAAFFDATFPDPVTNAAATARCWCASRSMGVRRMQNGAPVWTDVEMEWIER